MFTLTCSFSNLYSFLVILLPMVGIYILGNALPEYRLTIDVFPTPPSPKTASLRLISLIDFMESKVSLSI